MEHFSYLLIERGIMVVEAVGVDIVVDEAGNREGFRK